MTIVITSESNKLIILKQLSKDKRLLNLKFYTFSELKKKLYFDYNDKTLEYIMTKYNVNLNVAEVYLKNMYYLTNINDSKVNFLLNLKKELEEKELLIIDNHFKNYLSNKKIVVYTSTSLSKEEKLILKEIKANIEYMTKEKDQFIPVVYEAQKEQDEVLFVINKISELIYNGTDITKIKIIAKNEYKNTLTRYFHLFNIPFNMDSNNSYFSTFIAKTFLKNYDTLSIQNNILNLSEVYPDLSELINIINKSVLIKDEKIRKSFIIRDLKNTKIKTPTYEKSVLVTNLDNEFSDDEYVFLLGFNVNSYPKIYKDDDYLSDKTKESIGLDTSTTLNKLEKEKVIKKILSIKNLFITYKLNNYKGVFYPSLLIDELNLKVEKIRLNNNISYSLLNSNLMYAHALDNLIKFNIIDEHLSLYKKNLNIKYKEYNNTFKGIDRLDLKNRIGNELKLAYTNMQMYNECAFKYFVSKILKLDIYEDSFKAIIGNVVHHILETCLTKDYNIDVEIIKFIKDNDYELTKREYFYLEKLSKELKQVLSILKEQEKNSSLTNYLFESEISVYKDLRDLNITFKGLIDKVMYSDDSNTRTIAVVDYKTGSTFVTLDNLKYGLNMQLPIYLYLLKRSEQFKNATIAGFYIQKVLDNVPKISDKISLEEKRFDDLKLQGYSNSNPEILKMLDNNYLDSKIIKGLKYKKDGSLYSTAKILSSKEMEELTIIVEEKIDECIRNIIEGEFQINPKVIKGKNIACLYCKFKDICFMEKENEVVLGGEEDELDRKTVGSNN